MLTGTPVQNNLDEFHALLAFAAPGALGAAGAFKRVFADPIARSRDKEATPAERELGAARAACEVPAPALSFLEGGRGCVSCLPCPPANSLVPTTNNNANLPPPLPSSPSTNRRRNHHRRASRSELQQRVAGFVLRRTAALLERHLPPLSTFALFAAPSPLQLAVYRAVLRSPALSGLLYGGGGASAEGALPAIAALRKVCNHPRLLLAGGADDGGGGGAPVQGSGAAAAAAAALRDALARAAGANGAGAGDGAAASDPYARASGKLEVLRALLGAVISSGGRAVVVSTSTAALDLVDAELCRPSGCGHDECVCMSACVLACAHLMGKRGCPSAYQSRTPGPPPSPSPPITPPPHPPPQLGDGAHRRRDVGRRPPGDGRPLQPLGRGPGLPAVDARRRRGPQPRRREPPRALRQRLEPGRRQVSGRWGGGGLG